MLQQIERILHRERMQAEDVTEHDAVFLAGHLHVGPDPDSAARPEPLGIDLVEAFGDPVPLHVVRDHREPIELNRRP